MVVGPVLVTVVPPRTEKLVAVPSVALGTAKGLKGAAVRVAVGVALAVLADVCVAVAVELVVVWVAVGADGREACVAGLPSVLKPTTGMTVAASTRPATRTEIGVLMLARGSDAGAIVSR